MKRYDKTKIDEVLKSALRQETITEGDLAVSAKFIDESFGAFFGKSSNDIHNLDFCFLVPTRASMKSEEYWDEVYHFMPALGSLPVRERYTILSNLPPSAIDWYVDENNKIHGAVIFTPILEDMLSLSRIKPLTIYQLRGRVNDAAWLAKSYNAEIIGLGGIIPKLTNFGKSIKEDIRITTGHAGTVALFCRIFDDVYSSYATKKTPKIGLIGGGAIGRATIVALAPKITGDEVFIHDVRDDVNHLLKDELTAMGVSCKIAKSNQDVLEQADIVLSAVTSKIKTEGVSLKGKTVIDDSQPGSFSREEVIKAGGKLIWVVGKNERRGYTRRVSKYDYGKKGLVTNHDLWGCEAEVSSIAVSRKFKLALAEPVTGRHVRNIASLFDEFGIEPANYQSFGEYS